MLLSPTPPFLNSSKTKAGSSNPGAQSIIPTPISSGSEHLSEEEDLHAPLNNPEADAVLNAEDSGTLGYVKELQDLGAPPVWEIGLSTPLKASSSSAGIPDSNGTTSRPNTQNLDQGGDMLDNNAPAGDKNSKNSTLPNQVDDAVKDTSFVGDGNTSNSPASDQVGGTAAQWQGNLGVRRQAGLGEFQCAMEYFDSYKLEILILSHGQIILSWWREGNMLPT